MPAGATGAPREPWKAASGYFLSRFEVQRTSGGSELGRGVWRTFYWMGYWGRSGPCHPRWRATSAPQGPSRQTRDASELSRAAAWGPFGQSQTLVQSHRCSHPLTCGNPESWPFLVHLPFQRNLNEGGLQDILGESSFSSFELLR